jgi:hypothetical protein
MTQHRLGDFDDGMDVDVDEKYDPLSVTFRGGKEEPFHTWYPYLEGYSPEFVERVLRDYMGKAESVFDPFGGTVTTGFTAAELGLSGFYCEVNPVLQFVADVKTKARMLPESEREQVASELRAYVDRFGEDVEGAKPNTRLEASYHRAFKGSEFFDEGTLDEVLSTKTVVQNLETENRLISSLVTVSVLASLIPSSKLKRAGDVRFMDDDELAEGTPSLVEEVEERLESMSDDIIHKNAEIQQRPLLLAENASNIDKLPKKEFDSVITSPPYINGTNYFRNTRLELWFLGALQKPDDLTNYRQRALTAGINTVSGEYDVPSIDQIEEVVADLEEHGYDRRLPLMVAGYCSELQEIFKKTRKHLHDNSRVAIDIGDSKYAGVHVPADEMIVKLLEDIGYSHTDTVKLRDRHSNNGAELKQVLLVFDYS